MDSLPDELTDMRTLVEASSRNPFVQYVSYKIHSSQTDLPFEHSRLDPELLHDILPPRSSSFPASQIVQMFLSSMY